jgi:hypothetical protein
MEADSFFYDQGQPDSASVEDSATTAEPTSSPWGKCFRVQHTSHCCATLSASRPGSILRHRRQLHQIHLVDDALGRKGSGM